MKNKTLIFDLGGVLLDIFIERSFGALMALGIDAAILSEKRCLMDDMIQRYDRGDVSTTEFYSYIAQNLPQSVQALPLPIRLPCYDFTPITGPTFGRALLAVRLRTSGVPDSHGVTGGVYKARERIHRCIRTAFSGRPANRLPYPEQSWP